MNWTETCWGQHKATVGVFEVIVDPRDGAFRVLVGNLKVKKVFGTVAEAKAGAVVIVRAWCQRAIDELDAEEEK